MRKQPWPFFPPTHYFPNEELFAENLESAFDLAEQERRSIMVLGAQPNGPEIEYGRIEPGGTVRSRYSGLSRVNKFYEGPSL
mgnify:CR=1 FL=1